MEDTKEIIRKTAEYVKDILNGDATGHDWWHIERVRSMSLRIAATEKHADLFLVELSALLHDIGDYKLSSGHEDTADVKISVWLTSLGVKTTVVKDVLSIIDSVSFSKNVHRDTELTLEAKIVQDADRLDALGAIGIARAFAYGGAKGRPLYDPSFSPQKFSSSEERRQSTSHTINHFYEKILLLRELMQTVEGKKIAQKRHQLVKEYLAEFYAEWEGRL